MPTMEPFAPQYKTNFIATPTAPTEVLNLKSIFNTFTMRVLHFSIPILILFLFITRTECTDIFSDGFEPPLHLTNDRTIVANKHLPSIVSRQRRPACGQFCQLCNYNGKNNSFITPKASWIILNSFNTATLPYVCLTGTNVGRITNTLEPKIFYRGNFTEITKWRPRQLSTPFQKDAVKFVKIKHTNWSGVSRGRFVGNQWGYLNRRCMIMPIRSYQVLDPLTDRFVRKESVNNDRKNCVAFRTLAPYIQVQALWDSGDDFDLEVEEPDGDIIDAFISKTEAGRLNGDNNRQFCNSSQTFGRENILYDFNKKIEKGTYTVRFYHFEKCEEKATNWTVKILKNGIEAKVKRGTSNQGRREEDVVTGRIVLETKFKYP